MRERDYFHALMSFELAIAIKYIFTWQLVELRISFGDGIQENEFAQQSFEN